MMDTVSLPKIVLDDAGITKCSLAITQIRVFRKQSGEPALSILKGEQRDDIVLDEESRLHLAGLLQDL